MKRLVHQLLISKKARPKIKIEKTVKIYKHLLENFWKMKKLKNKNPTFLCQVSPVRRTQRKVKQRCLKVKTNKLTSFCAKSAYVSPD